MFPMKNLARKELIVSAALQHFKSYNNCQHAESWKLSEYDLIACGIQMPAWSIILTWINFDPSMDKS